MLAVSILERKMNSSTKNLTALGRTILNPNAAEFIPKAFIPSSSNSISVESTKTSTGEDCGKVVLDRTNSANSNASDDECRQYWRSQLPDDITPDFDYIGQVPGDNFDEEPVSVASGLDYVNTPTVISNATVLGENIVRNGQTDGVFHDKRKQVTGQSTNYTFSGGDSRFAVAQLNEGRSSTPAQVISHGTWDHRSAASVDQLLLSGNQDRQLTLKDGNDIRYRNELFVERSFPEELGEIDPVDLLVNEFPGFAAQSLADIYHANDGDLSLTIEMLTQLELQDDGGPPRQLQSQSSPNLTLMDFPALSRSELVNGFSQFHADSDLQQSGNIQRAVEAESLFGRSASSGDTRAGTDFAAVVRKNAAHHSAQWHFERNGVGDYTLGSTRQSLGIGSFAGDSRIANGERSEHFSQARRTHRPPPQIWLETGEAVADIYSKLREEARDHARVRNAYFEQARQAYLVGNKALAKELSAKGQWHNGLMKAAHSKAGEAIFRQRNLSVAQVQGLAQGQSGLLDLHGLHVNEAIPLLKHELAALRVAARSTGQRQQVFICVGTGHHTKGSRTPARLPVAIERYLAEDEHLHFTETQPGMLRVVLS